MWGTPQLSGHPWLYETGFGGDVIAKRTQYNAGTQQLALLHAAHRHTVTN